jgi:hypothetical protein
MPDHVPANVARQLVGSMAHLLRAAFSELDFTQFDQVPYPFQIGVFRDSHKLNAVWRTASAVTRHFDVIADSFQIPSD